MITRDQAIFRSSSQETNGSRARSRTGKISEGENSPNNNNNSNDVPLNTTFESHSDDESSGTKHYQDAFDVSRIESLGGNQAQHTTISIPRNASRDSADSRETYLGGVSSTSTSAYSTWSLLDEADSLYVALFSTFGTIARVFIGRFFGRDCAEGSSAPQDVFQPFFAQVCVTNNGMTDQTGGALFLDLPTNMIGCFVMGLLSFAFSVKHHPLPWLRHDHPLQQHRALLLGLRTGFCGCLTTFASWNSQMVRMLDGTDAELGSQIAPALFGYVIGLCCAMASFMMGRHTHEWLEKVPVDDTPKEVTSPRNTNTNESTNQTPDVELGPNLQEEENRESQAEHKEQHHHHQHHGCGERYLSIPLRADVGPIMFFAGFMTLFVFVAVTNDMTFYRDLVLSMVISPVGAILRWKLSKLNSRPGPWKSYQWVPWGTLIANVLASVISLAANAANRHFLADFNDPWVSSILPAVETGFAGSLSTVSTMMNEIFNMNRPGRAYRYAFGSVLICMTSGLLVYIPIVRT